MKKYLITAVLFLIMPASLAEGQDHASLYKTPGPEHFQALDQGAAIIDMRFTDLGEKEVVRVLYDVVTVWRIRSDSRAGERDRYTKLFGEFMSYYSRNDLYDIITAGNLHPFIHLSKKTIYDPLDDAGEFTSQIKLNDITKNSPNSYKFHIQETIYDPAGREQFSYPLLITFTIERRAEDTPEERFKNPLGISIIEIAGVREKPNLENWPGV